MRPRGNALPGEERHERAGAASLVAVVEVVRAGVVEVDGLLDESQPEAADVEVDVLLRVARDSGDVVQTLGRAVMDALLASLTDSIVSMQTHRMLSYSARTERTAGTRVRATTMEPMTMKTPTIAAT